MLLLPLRHKSSCIRTLWHSIESTEGLSQHPDVLTGGVVSHACIMHASNMLCVQVLCVAC